MNRIIRMVMLVAFILMLGTFSTICNATVIDPPSGSEIFVSKKVFIDKDTRNGSFETGTTSYWSPIRAASSGIYTTSFVTNVIEAAQGDYYAELTVTNDPVLITGNRCSARFDHYGINNVSSEENGNIFKYTASFYFPSATNNYAPAQAFYTEILLFDVNSYKGNLGGCNLASSSYTADEWHTVEVYMTTTEASFTGVSPRVSFYKDGGTDDVIYQGYVDNISIEQGFYKKVGTVVFIK